MLLHKPKDVCKAHLLKRDSYRVMDVALDVSVVHWLKRST